MHRIISVYGRKIFSVTLIFNALLTITCSAGLLWGLYTENWHIYAPYLANGNLYWIVVVAAIVNIFPAASLGKVHTGRLWFHHYVYGFFVIIASSLWIIFFTSVSIFNVFLINTQNLAANVGRFFFLGGVTLVLDDLPDVHKVTFTGLRWLKTKAHQARTALQITQFALGIGTLYVLAAVVLSTISIPQWVTPANFIQIGTLLVTSLTCFASVRHRVWHKISLHEHISHHH
jgi:hypothetical protein